MYVNAYASIRMVANNYQAINFQPIKIKMLLKQLKLALSSLIVLTELLIIAIPNDTKATEHLVYLHVCRERRKMFLLIQE